MKRTLLGLAATTLFVTGLGGTDTASARSHTAKAMLTTFLGNRIGTVRFLTIGRHTEVRVSMNTGGLSDIEVDVFHAFHVHANNNEANGNGCIVDASAAPFTSADGHYNPQGQGHGLHVGDMPVLYFNSDGSVEARFRLDQIKPADVIGKAVIVHAGTDNYGNVPVGSLPTQYTPNSAEATTMTSDTGNAGSRVACGVVTP